MGPDESIEILSPWFLQVCEIRRSDMFELEQTSGSYHGHFIKHRIYSGVGSKE
jgi:hypothetical protein